MRVRFYQVECGDAASIMYEGNDGREHHIFVDAGYERTYRDILAGEVRSIGAAGEQIDLWIVSHIHDDHIGGAISYIKAIEKGEAEDVVSRWWYNHPIKIDGDQPAVKSVIGISEIKSFAQGEKLTSYMLRTGHLPCLDIIQRRPSTDVAGLKITLLSPASEALARLREKYKDVGVRAMDYHELTAISEPKATIANDYHQKVENFALDSFSEDASIENNSSIAVLVERNGRKILWLADAWPSTIIGALRELGYSADKPLEVDLVKVAHHGSRGNNSNELYDLIRCDKYVFCASGENKHNLPTKACMVQILKNKYRPKNSCYEFLFTHANATLRGIFAVDGDDIYKRLRFSMRFSDGKWLEETFD